MKKYLLLIALGFGSYQLYQHFSTKPYIGAWQLDMEPYLSEYAPSSINQTSKKLIDKISSENTLSVTDDSLILNLTNPITTIKIDYIIDSQNDDCYNLSVVQSGDKGTAIICVDADKLKLTLNTNTGESVTQHFVRQHS